MALLEESQQQYYDGDSYGNYQFVSLEDIINQFMIVYVGEDKIISKARRTDVAFHAQRALAELSFDTFKSCKTQEFVVPASLQMILPQDYVNYTRVLWSDDNGIKHPLYPTKSTQNPFRPQQDSDGDFIFDNGSLVRSGNLIDNSRYHGGSSHWQLNKNIITDEDITTETATGVIGDPITDSIGWFWDNNKLIGYNLTENHGFYQEAPIYSGEEYEITFTISDYSSGSVRVTIVDENRAYTQGTIRSADGTYTETLTASENLSNIDQITSIIAFGIPTATTTALTIDDISIVRVGDSSSSTTWEKYKGSGSDSTAVDQSTTTSLVVDADDYFQSTGGRYGIDPQYAQANGSYYIDCDSGKIHFSSNLSGSVVVLDYISDSLGTPEEMQVHKFAEEAMYKWLSHAILASRANVPEYVVARYKKERFAAIRNAKLRLSNIKLEEITQVLRGKSKWIKH